MKNKVKKTIFSLLLALGFTFTLSSGVNAASVTPRIGPYYLAEGVGHVDYYITASASAYSTQIGNAAYKWVYTGYGYNPIYMYQTTNFYASNMDIYASDDGAYAGYNAYTAFVDVRTNGDVYVDPTTSFWDYGEIYLNTNGAAFGGKDSNGKQGVIGHEMGHVFGLDHNDDNIYSIMCSDYKGRVVYTPGQADSDGINAMYH